MFRQVMTILESSIDVPQSELEPLVWQKQVLREGTFYVLWPTLKQKIYALLREYPRLHLLDAESIRIVGSICTNQYQADADIDVHVLIPATQLGPELTADMWVKDVMRFFKEPGRQYFVGDHPIEIYLQLDPEQDMVGDAVYDLIHDQWLKGPKLVAADFDPYTAYAEVLADIRDMVRAADLDLGELGRDVVDYEVIKRALTRLDDSQRSGLLTVLTNKLTAIEADVDKLMKDKKEWVDMRHQATKVTPELAHDQALVAHQWEVKNALAKMIARYGYYRTISELEALMDERGGKLSDKDVPAIKGIIGGRP